MLIDNTTFELFTALLKAVADPTRRRILFLLRHNGEQSVNEIAKQLELAQPTTSQHLRILKEAGALIARKDGQQVLYNIASIPVCDALMDFLVLFQKETKKAQRS